MPTIDPSYLLAAFLGAGLYRLIAWGLKRLLPPRFRVWAPNLPVSKGDVVVPTPEGLAKSLTPPPAPRPVESAPMPTPPLESPTALKVGGPAFAQVKNLCSACGPIPDLFCGSCVHRARVMAVGAYVERSAIPRLVAALQKNPKAQNAFRAGPKAALGVVIDILRGVGEQPKSEPQSTT